MENSKLFSALSYFDKYEQNRLRKYIHSPYFNKNEALIVLFEEIIRHHNKVKSNKAKPVLSVEKIWAKIYSDKTYDDVRFRKLKSDLLKLIEGFLAQQIYEENPIFKANYLIEAVGKKSMTELYESTTRTANRLSEKQIYQPADYYLHQFQVERNKYGITNHTFVRGVRYNFEEIANNLDKFYISEKLRYFCDVLTQQSLISHKYELLFIDQIIENIKANNYEDVPPISMYYQIYLTLTESENLDHYFKLKELLVKFGGKFPVQEAEAIYNSAINYCIRKSNKGDGNFINELFFVYQDYLDKEIIATSGFLAPWHFKNIVAAATKLEKYEWTKTFIYEYQEKLPVGSRSNAVSFNLARLHFFKKEYDKVTSLLREVEYEDISYNLGSKALLIRTYYETDEIDALDSLLESFRTYLGRQDKIPELRKNNYRGFIKFIRKLSRVIPGDKKAITKIREEFDNSEGMVSTDEWLKEKIEALEKGKRS